MTAELPASIVAKAQADEIQISQREKSGLVSTLPVPRPLVGCQASTGCCREIGSLSALIEVAAEVDAQVRHSWNP